MSVKPFPSMARSPTPINGGDLRANVYHRHVPALKRYALNRVRASVQRYDVPSIVKHGRA